MSRFDLRSLTGRESRSDVGTKLQASAGVGFGLLLIGLGAYIGFVQPRTVSVTSVVEAFALFMVGVGLVAAGRWLYRTATRFPAFLTVSASGLIFEATGEVRETSVAWESRRLRILLYDTSGVPARKDGTRAHPPYSIIPTGGQRIPLPEAAYREVLNQARAHGLVISRQVIGSSTSAWGEVVVHSIRPRGRGSPT